jgi:hypothetical protein
MLSLTLTLVGGVCTLLGILTALGALPAFIEAEEAIGAVAGTTAFMWGLAALFFLASIASSMSGGGGGGSGQYD